MIEMTVPFTDYAIAETKGRKKRANEADKYADGEKVEVVKGKSIGLVGTVVGRTIKHGKAAVVIEVGDGVKIVVGPRLLARSTN